MGIDAQKAVEETSVRYFKPLTLDQRCADLLTLRLDRLTTREFITSLLACADVRASFVIVQACRMDVGNDEQVLGGFVTTWLSQKMLTELMTCGSINESVVISALGHYDQSHSLFTCGMVCSNEKTWKACCLHAAADLRHQSEEPIPSPWALCVRLVLGYNVPPRMCRDYDYRVASFFRPSSTSSHAQMKMLKCSDPETARHLSEPYFIHVGPQMETTQTIFCPTVILPTLSYKWDSIAARHVTWSYLSKPMWPSFTSDYHVAVVMSRVPFSSVIKSHSGTHGPLRLVRLFQDRLQALYSRAKGGVDDASQF